MIKDKNVGTEINPLANNQRLKHGNMILLINLKIWTQNNNFDNWINDKESVSTEMRENVKHDPLPF